MTLGRTHLQVCLHAAWEDAGSLLLLGTLESFEGVSLRLNRWAERQVTGDPPMDPHWRRNLEAILDTRRLIVVGACLETPRP